MEITTSSTQETKELARKVAKEVSPGDILALYGDLGSGKTTFTSYLVHALGFKDRVQSPTFIIMRLYQEGGNKVKKVYHLDLYRLISLDEVLEIGWQEMVEDKDSVLIIEWPEIVEDILPENVRKIKFTYLEENVRKITLQNLS